MDKGAASNACDVTIPSCNLESICLESFNGALGRIFAKNKPSEETSLASVLKEQFFDLNSNFIQDFDGALTASGTTTANFLKIVNGALLVFGASSKMCIVATSSSSCPFQKDDFLGYSLNELIHEEDISKIDIDESGECKERCLFNCRLRKGDKQVIGAKPENCDRVSYMMMKCIKFVQHVGKEKLIDLDTKESSFIFCLATPADVPAYKEVPPNQTVNTRDKIPQPEKFCTRQHLNGELEAVGLTYDDVLQSKYKIPPHMKNVVETCLRHFIKQNQNGNSMKDLLLQQVINQGTASTRANRIQLSHDTTANWLIKSELVPRVPNPGELQQIFSVHLVYRQGTLKGLNLEGLRNIIPVPPESQSLKSEEETVTMTTTSIATTTSFSPDHFLPPNHFPNQTVKNESFVSDGRAIYPSWQRPAARHSLESTKDFLTGMPGAEQPSMENLNGVVSPPPHLDGPMVHAVGAGSNQLMTSSSANFQISPGQPLSATSFVRPNDAGPRSTFLSPNPDTGMLNPGTFPGPPCVDLASCDIKTEILPPVSSTSVTSVFVDSITTMRMDANVTTTQSRNNPATASPAIMHSTPFSPKPSRACATPDKAPSSCQSSPPKRPRSASINTTPGNSASLKRTASTLSEDSGIGELGTQCKRSPIQRSKSKDKSKVPGAQKNKILAQLLSSKNSDEVNVSYTGGPSSSSKSSNVTITSTQALSNKHSSLAASLNNATSSISNQIPSNKVPGGSPFTSGSQVVGSQMNPGSSQPGQQPSAEISPDEREWLDEALSCYESIISSAPNHPTLPLQSNQFQNNPTILQQPTMNNNVLPPSRQDSMINTPPLNQPTDMFSGLTSQSQTLLSSPQPLSTAQVLPTPQTLPGPPPYAANTASPSGANPSFRRIVPTGQETCPNRVVGSGGMLSPKTQQGPPVSQYHRDFAPTDNWAGQEPLVDLGAFPPPAGINPRMTIPSHSQMNQPMLGNTPAVKVPPNVNPSNPQVNMSRMAYQPSSIGMSGGAIVNLPSHLQNPNNGITPSISPRNFTNNISPNAGFPQIRSVNSNLAPPYNANVQQQARYSANGNMKARLLRQQPRPQYRGEMMGMGQQFSYNKPELSRYLPPQRANGTMMRTRKPTPVLQRTLPSPDVPNAYNQINPAPRFATNQVPTNQYSTLPPNQFANSTSYNNELSPSMNFDPGMRSTGVMPPQNSNQFATPSYNNTMNSVGPMMGNNYPGDQLNPALSGSPMGKPQLKRSRSKKGTRKKTGSIEEGPWGDDMTNNAYKQRTLMQMTIGNMHQRPQPTYNTPIDGALPSSGSMMSPQGGGMQTLNLNSLMTQNKSKIMDKVGIDPGVSPGSFQAVPNSNNLQSAPNRSNTWSSPDLTMNPSLVDDGMLAGIFDDPSSQTNPFPLDGMAAVDSNVTMNSNINNNKIADVSSTFRYTATAAMLPSASSVSQVVDERSEKKRAKKTQILESLLLKKDE